MQYLNIIKYTRDLGLRTVHASSIKTKGLRSHSVNGPDARARAANPDAWYRTNVGARSQGDFWLHMLVNRDNKGPLQPTYVKPTNASGLRSSPRNRARWKEGKPDTTEAQAKVSRAFPRDGTKQASVLQARRLTMG